MDVDRVTFEHWFKFKVAWSRDVVSRSALTQIPSAAFISRELRRNPVPSPLSVSCFSILPAVSALNFIFRTCTWRILSAPGHTFQFGSTCFVLRICHINHCHHLWTDLFFPRGRRASSKKVITTRTEIWLCQLREPQGKCSRKENLMSI